MGGRQPELPAFHYDFGSPFAYLAAERVEAVLGPVAWRPVFLVGVFKATGRRSWVYGPDPGPRWAEVEERLAVRGLPPLALAPEWAERLVPSATPARSTLLAQRAATAASDAGRARAWALALYRRVFAARGDLTDPALLLDVAEEAGVPPEAVRAAMDDPATRERVRAATADAVAAGVSGVPSVVVGGRVFWGDDRLEEAARALGRAGGAPA